MTETLPDPERVWVGGHLARRFDLDLDVWLTWCGTHAPAQQLQPTPDGARCPTCTVTAYGEIRAESIREARRSLADGPGAGPCTAASVPGGRMMPAANGR